MKRILTPSTGYHYDGLQVEKRKETWRKSLEKEMKVKHWTWGQVQHCPQDKGSCKSGDSFMCNQAKRGLSK